MNSTKFKQQFYVCILALFYNSILFGQQAITQRLTTSGIEHTSTVRGVLKYAFDDEDYVREDGEGKLFTNGFTTSVQMGGYDEEGNLGVCANFYYFQNNTDFHSGLLESSGTLIEGSDKFYNKIWKIHDFEILELNEKYNNGNLTIEDLSEDIKTWPGKGNPFVDASFVSEEVAPFFDSDFDGIYNPLMGDYPVVSSKDGTFVPSQFTFNVYHDLGLHAISAANPMKIQFYQTQYVINCNDGDLERTVFTILKTKSQNSEIWKNSYLGLYVDHDLGCDTRDRFGYDDETNSMYTYNQGGYDDTFCDYGYPIHNSRSAIKALVFNENIHTLNSTIPNIDPTNSGQEVYNRLSGLFGDGTPITYGGNGYNTTSLDTILHLYSDFPNEPLGWSQETIEAEDSRYGFFTSVALGDIAPGETKQIEFAEIVMVSETEEGLDIFNSYRNRISDLNEAHIKYINDESLCPKVEICDEGCVWPGDANNDGKVDNCDYIYIAAASTTEDLTSRSMTDTEWYAHTSEDWGTNATIVDLKHCDANGNGKINGWDNDVITKNFGLQNDSYELSEVPAFIGDPYGLHFDNIKEEYSVTGTSAFDKRVFTYLLIGDDDLNISDSIIGISYDIKWDTSMMKLDKTPSTFLAYTFFWDEFNFEGSTPDDFYYPENTTKIHAAQYDYYQNINEGGRLAQFRWEIKDDATTTNSDGRDTIDIIFSNIFALNAIGEQVEVGLREQYSVIITNLQVVDPVAVNDLVSINRLSVYPNPTSNILNYECDDCGNITKVSLISVGAKSITETHPSKIHSIDVSTVPVGLYILKVDSERGVYTKKVIVE